MPRIFISYSRKDLGFVRRLVGDLEKAGYEVWWDPGDVQPGADWTDAIPTAIASSDYFIVVLSAGSAQSEWVENEYTQALAFHKKIVPLMLERSQVPFALNTINYVDFTSANYAANLNALLTALGYAGEMPLRPKPLSLPFSPLVYVVPILIGIILLLWLLLPPVFTLLTPPPSSTPSPVPSRTAVVVTVPIVGPGETLTPTKTMTLTTTPSPPPASGLFFCVFFASGNTISVRAGPGTNYPPLGEPLAEGSCLDFSARNQDGTWIQIGPIQRDSALQQYAGGWIPHGEIAVFVDGGNDPGDLPVVTGTLSGAIATTPSGTGTPTASTTATSAPTTPTGTADALQTLQAAFQDVDRQFQEMFRANIAYNVPKSMKLEETIVIELLLKPSLYQEGLATQLAEGNNFLTSTAEVGQLATQIVEGSGLVTSTAEPGQPVTAGGQEVDVVTGDVIITPRMKAVLKSLRSGAFEVQELHDNPEQPISSLEATRWRWSVTAKEPGAQTLELVISRLIKQGDNEYWREVEAYRADINVQVTPAQRLRALDWKWILGILVTALLIPLFFRWYDARRKAADQPKQPEPPKRKSRKK